MTAFPIPLESVTVHDNGHALPAYSDEIVQDFHLFPFYPRPQSGLGTSCSLPDMFYILSLNGGKCNKFHLLSLYFPA